MAITPSELKRLKLAISPNQINVLLPKGSKVVRVLPDTTPVTQMGLSPAVINSLSADAKKLTKGDLVALWRSKVTANAAAVSVNDLNVIKDAFTGQIGKGPGNLAIDIYCCCCPCCCATAVISPTTVVV
jgi:hypothetical protein